MNIFIVDPNPLIAAIHLHNRHCVKMVLESAQLLSTAQRLAGNEDPRIYRKTHVNHPCSIWVRTSKQNYIWLVQHFEALFKEFTYRYRNIHKSSLLFDLLKYPPEQLPNIGLTPFVTAMPDKYKVLDSIQSYRNYYLGEKIKDNYWTNRTDLDLDSWLTDHLTESQFKRGKNAS